jgi:glycosyltransferase involved in cell wall biosynthesis
MVVHNLASEWVKQGHNVCVFNQLANQPISDKSGYSVCKFSRPFSYFKVAPHRFPFAQYVGWSLKRHLDEYKPDFISAHFGYPTGAWLSKIKPKPRFLITCHGSELTKLPWGDRNLYKMDKVLAEALNASAGAVAISRHARELMEELGVAPEKIVDIPNGVNVERFRKKVGFDLRNLLGVPRNSLIILSVGREHSQKAFDVGIKAFARVAEKMGDLYYLILGRGTSVWAPLVKDLGMNKRIILHEGLGGDDLVGAYQQSDIFFSPSAWEMMSLVVLEAMASRLPLIVTNVSGSQDLVKSGHNGILVSPGQIEEMAAAIQNIAGNGSLRSRMAEANARQSEVYSWDRISRRYLEYC